MATRSFRLYLINQTPMTLKQVQLAVDHGDWTAPWYAPDTIAPGQTVGWQTESSGDIPILGNIGTGTQGSITFEIEDANHFLSVPAPGKPDVGHQDHLYIFWDTPFLGNTTRDIQWRVLSDIPAEGASFATQGYVDGPSSAYQILSYLHPEYDGPGSPCPAPWATSGDGPTPINTDGWLPVAPGIFGLPIPDPAIPHAQVDIYVQVKQGVVISDDGNAAAPVFTSSPSDPTSVNPCSNGPLGAFQGTWGDDTNENIASIVVAISPDTSPTHAPVHSTPVIQHVLHEQIPGAERSMRVNQTSAPASKLSASQTEGVSSPSNRTSAQGGFTVKVTDNSFAPQVHLQEEHVTTTSVLVDHYTGDMRSNPGIAKAPGASGASHSGVMPAHASGPQRTQKSASMTQAPASPSSTGSAKNAGVALANMEFVDTLALSPTISLHLYNQHDDRTKQWIGYRVRYVRIATDGSLIEDVMLGESMQPPK